MTNIVHTNVSGTWKEVPRVCENVSGTWKDCLSGYVNVFGVWKITYAGVFMPPGAAFVASVGYLLDATARLEWNNDGNVYDESSGSVVEFQWLYNGDAADYEVRFHVISFTDATPTISGTTFDTWVTANGDYAVELFEGSPGDTNSASVQI